ncbi:MAG: ATP-binding protein [Sphaerochaeta sp.]|jgi:DNA replication protein DnaC|nr:ATP-binding protein [Spirochaetales bacterium]
MAYSIEQIRLDRDEKILLAFKRLRLPGMANHFREILEGTVEVDGLDVSTILEQFIDVELGRRTDNKADKLIREARLWYPSATLEHLQGNARKLSPQLISTLSKVRFIEAGAFIIIYGGPRSGTTYLGCAIGASACRLNRRTRYVRYFDLLSNLVEAKQVAGSLQDGLEALRTVPCLIVDDWMNSNMSQNELLLMREIMDYRPKYGGTILISHSHPDSWKGLVDSDTSYRDSMFKTLTEGAMIIELA